jgi:hypothetical protein
MGSRPSMGSDCTGEAEAEPNTQTIKTQYSTSVEIADSSDSDRHRAPREAGHCCCDFAMRGADIDIATTQCMQSGLDGGCGWRNII